MDFACSAHEETTRSTGKARRLGAKRPNKNAEAGFTSSLHAGSESCMSGTSARRRVAKFHDIESIEWRKIARKRPGPTMKFSGGSVQPVESAEFRVEGYAMSCSGLLPHSSILWCGETGSGAV